jgi:hypothetical protein
VSTVSGGAARTRRAPAIDLGRYIRQKSTDQTVCLGPAVLDAAGSYYCVWDFHAKTGPHVGKADLSTQDFETAEARRMAFHASLINSSWKGVLIDFNDELEMAKAAKAMWPCDKLDKIAACIAAERQAA